MTLRARPVARRRGRAGWDSGDRRNNLINLGFFLAIGLSAVILVGYAAWSWYDSHFGAAAVVNGQVITKDQLLARYKIESFRLDYVSSRIQTLVALGRISAADGSQQQQFIDQRRQQLQDLTLDRLVDVALQAKLAADNGVVVSEADLDAQILDEATTSEQRHTWMIEIEPRADATTGDITDDERRTALGRAQRALAKLKSGATWEDVARTDSDSGLAAQAGDLGWLSKDSGYDEKFMTAVFATDQNVPTEIIEGEDGTFRIGRYTEVAAETVDTTFQATIVEAGIPIADYREAARGDVTRRKLSEKIVADLSKPGLQRHVLEIFLPEPNESTIPNEPGAKVRWIVFSPKDDIAKAKDVPADDPSWAKAKADAETAYTVLHADITKFDGMARELSDETSAEVSGGKQPWYYGSSSLDKALLAEIFKTGRKPDDLIPPVKGELGWYVIQYQRASGDAEAFMDDLKAKATSEALFRQLAIDQSEGEGAKDGGDLGWIATGQLSEDVDTAVFATKVGEMSDVIPVSGEGVYLLRVLAEETREPTEEQLKIFKESGFDTWYTRQKTAAKIDYPLAGGTGTA